MLRRLLLGDPSAEPVVGLFRSSGPRYGRGRKQVVVNGKSGGVSARGVGSRFVFRAAFSRTPPRNGLAK
jgi:hypothetical protein